MCRRHRSKPFLSVALRLLSVASAHLKPQVEKDPHPPASANADYRKIKFFLGLQYCGESPFGKQASLHRS